MSDAGAGHGGPGSGGPPWPEGGTDQTGTASGGAQRTRFRVETLTEPAGLAAIAVAWDELASVTPSPYLTSAWALAWWRTAPRRVQCWLLRDAAGQLAAGLLVQRGRGGLRGAADVHSGDWGVVARDPAARDAMWRLVGRRARPVGRIRLPALDLAATQGATGSLARLGFEFAVLDSLDSPFLTLPASHTELLAGVSRNLRSQVGRSARSLARDGRLVLRTEADPSAEALSGDLERFLRLEAAGWKGRDGTAINSSPRTSRLYREFADVAARQGILRLVLLELDGELIAGDLSARIGRRTSLLKTAYDEGRAAQRPGLVLRSEALRAAIEEGCEEYDFLGGPDSYKTRWGGGLHTRQDLLAVRGAWRAEAVYRLHARPALGRLRGRLRSAQARAPRATAQLDKREEQP